MRVLRALYPRLRVNQIPSRPRVDDLGRLPFILVPSKGKDIQYIKLALL